MDLRLSTLRESICGDDVLFDTTMNVTSYEYDRNGKAKNRVVDADGNPKISWKLENIKCKISFAQCPISKVFDLAVKQVKVQIQRSRDLTKEEFVEMTKTPFYVRDMTAKRPIGAGAFKSINALAEEGDFEGLERIQEFLEKRLSHVKHTKKSSK